MAVVVVHEPGAWFEQTLDAFAEQDYPNLRFLFLLAQPSAEAQRKAASEMSSSNDDTGQIALESHLETTIKLRLPNAFVRALGANPGFGAAANEVLRLVEGQNGFFLFCHDDVALEPSAVRLMVEELYRSNAGLVGPKIVDWDDPGVLQSVGLGADRFGELDQPIEDGEVDQEQHDGVRDVFVLPSACLLARADLFRELGGFDPEIDFYGEDLELCWRVHHSGARVVVAPAATVRHRGQLVDRRPDLAHQAKAARHRLRAVATLTGRARLPGRIVEMVVLTIVELVVGLFTGRFRSAVASLRALVGVVVRLPSIISRRRVVAPFRRVPEREVLGLQQRGSARLVSFLRSRETATFVGTENNVRRWRQSTTAPVFVWAGVLAALAFGSRSWLSAGIPSVGEFLAFPESPRELLGSYTSGWNPNGLGATSPNPTGWATLSALSTLTLFRMGLLHTAFILGLVVVGLIGLWKLATVFPSTRARLGALLVYAASPLVGGAMAIGSLNTLVAYAATPWIIHTLRRAVGVATADPQTAVTDLADGLLELSWQERVQRSLQVGIVIALATAFTPVMLVIALLISMLLALSTLLALAPWRTAAQYAGLGAVGVLVGALLNMPWIASWSWSAIVGPSPIGDPGRGLVDLAAFEIGPTDFAYLGLVLYVPVLAAVLLGRAWRLTWAIRSATLVMVFGAIAVFADSGSLPFAAPEAGVLLAPVAVGLAVSAAAALAAFDLDVRGGNFGWRQPLGLMASAAVVVGLAPGAYAVGDGSWNAPRTTLSSLIDRTLPDVVADGASGDYNVLVLGDARLLPLPSVEYRDGVSFNIMSSDELDTRDRWPAPPTSASGAIADALDQIAAGSTQRAGRLLAPLGIRFVVVPKFDGVVSTPAAPLELPVGLGEALDEQLDIVAFPALPTVDFYQNSAWLPTVSLLSGEAEVASRSAGDEALVRADLTESVPAFVGSDHRTAAVDDVEAGVLHLAVPFDANWSLRIDGIELEPRRAFGVTTAFDITTAGNATLSYETPGSRSLLLVLQAVLWLLAIFGATRVSVPLARRGVSAIEDETLISLDGDESPLVGFDPGLDIADHVAGGAWAESLDDMAEPVTAIREHFVADHGVGAELTFSAASQEPAGVSEDVIRQPGDEDGGAPGDEDGLEVGDDNGAAAGNDTEATS